MLRDTIRRAIFTIIEGLKLAKIKDFCIEEGTVIFCETDERISSMLCQFYIVLEPLSDDIVIEAMLSPEFRIEVLHNDSRIDYR